MARPRTGDKAAEIQRATIAEVMHVGSTAVSVNKIAERAGLAVGTLYRYHKTKDDLLLAVFLDVKTQLHDRMMEAAGQHENPADRLRAMWFALVGNGIAAPHEFLFAEMMSSQTNAASKQTADLQDMRKQVLDEMGRGIDDGTLIDASPEAIETMLAAPAVVIARQAALSGTPPDRNHVDEVFSLVWRSVARNADSPIS